MPVRVAALLNLIAAAPTPVWQRTWTVAAITGPHAGAAGLGGIVGQPVVLAPDRARTPVDEPCPTAPDYADLRARPRAELGRHFGAFWRWPAALGARPVFGWVRCGRSNLGAFAFADARHGYLFFEDGIVIELR